MDIAGEEGASVLCFADGTVGTVGESTILGNYVTVNHESGISTLYAHCSAITASAGQSVRKGENALSASKWPHSCSAAAKSTESTTESGLTTAASSTSSQKLRETRSPRSENHIVNRVQILLPIVHFKV